LLRIYVFMYMPMYVLMHLSYLCAYHQQCLNICTHVGKSV